MDKSCVIANVEKGVKCGINGDILRPKAAFLDPTIHLVFQLNKQHVGDLILWLTYLI